VAKNRAIYLPEPHFLPKLNKFALPPTSYKPTHDRQAYFLALLGLNEVQMSQIMNISTKTITLWKTKHPTFKEAMLKGKVEADSKVAHSVYLAALGFEHPDEVILTNRVKQYDRRGRVVKEWTEPLRVPTVKKYPPNVTAALKWLQVRQPEIWSDKIKIEGKLSINHTLDLSEFSIEELELLSKLSEKRRERKIEDIDYQEEAV